MSKLGEKKEGNPYETFSEWYTKDYQSFIEYNITDVELVDKLEDKMKLIELALTMVMTLKQTIWTFLVQPNIGTSLSITILEEEHCCSSKRVSSKSEKFEGAY